MRVTSYKQMRRIINRRLTSWKVICPECDVSRTVLGTGVHMPTSTFLICSNCKEKL